MAVKRGGGNFIAEWFGHRIYPRVVASAESVAEQQLGRCPFLTAASGVDTDCIKATKSRGVCTISSTSNRERQDWLACPYRALDGGILLEAARQLFVPAQGQAVTLVPAVRLGEPGVQADAAARVDDGDLVLSYVQTKLGGEITLARTNRSPEFSFDSTMVELVRSESGHIAVGRYGIVETQTMDFHGTYGHATANLNDAIRLHSRTHVEFADNIASHPEWMSEGVEGPNPSNAFKRTFYQMMFKFQLGGHDMCAGCVLAVPKAVWDSWQPFLGRPTMVPLGDVLWELQRPVEVELRAGAPAWIVIFDIDAEADTTPNPLTIPMVIRTDAPTLSHYALDVTPDIAISGEGSADRLYQSVLARFARWWPDLRLGAAHRPM